MTAQPQNDLDEIAKHRRAPAFLKAVLAGDRKTARRHLARIFKWDDETAWYMVEHYMEEPQLAYLRKRIEGGA